MKNQFNKLNPHLKLIHNKCLLHLFQLLNKTKRLFYNLFCFAYFLID